MRERDDGRCVVGGVWWEGKHHATVTFSLSWLWLEFLREFGYKWSFGKHHGYIWSLPKYLLLTNTLYRLCVPRTDKTLRSRFLLQPMEGYSPSPVDPGVEEG